MDADHQVIVAIEVTNKQNYGDEVVPLVEQIKELTGQYPEQVSAEWSMICTAHNLLKLFASRKPSVPRT